MNWRKNVGFLTAMILAALCTLAALGFLFYSAAQYATVRRQFAEQTQELSRLNNRFAFPSPDNVEQTRTNLVVLDGALQQLLTAMQQGQAVAENIEPAAFAQLLERTKSSLEQHAKAATVQLPERFAFGFDRYLAGAQPQAADIPRLTVQLKDIALLCQVCYDSKIQGIRAVRRQVFDRQADEPIAAEGGRGRRSIAAEGAGEPAPEMAASLAPKTTDLYSAEAVELDVTVSEIQLWNLLNNLAGAHPVMSVTQITCASDKPKYDRLAEFLKSKGKEAEGKGAAGEAVKATPEQNALLGLPHKERIVAGNELVQATLTLDVYQFSTNAMRKTP